MFSDRIRFRAVLYALVFYVAASTIAFAVVVHLSLPENMATSEDAQRWAEADPDLLRWQQWLGTVLGILSAYLCGVWSKSSGLRNCLVFGMLLIAYGLLGIFLHPSHPTAVQIAKLLSPIPLSLAGGLLHRWVGNSLRNRSKASTH